MGKRAPCPNCGKVFEREWFTAAGGGYRCPHCQQVVELVALDKPKGKRGTGEIIALGCGLMVILGFVLTLVSMLAFGIGDCGSQCFQ